MVLGPMVVTRPIHDIVKAWTAVVALVPPLFFLWTAAPTLIMGYKTRVDLVVAVVVVLVLVLAVAFRFADLVLRTGHAGIPVVCLLLGVPLILTDRKSVV